MRLSGADFYLQRLKRVRCVISIASASASALSRGCSQVQINQHSTELIIDLSVAAWLQLWSWPGRSRPS